MPPAFIAGIHSVHMTLYIYIMKEIWPNFLASLLVFVFVMVAAQMLSITELIVTSGVKIMQVAGMIFFLLPDILSFALPAVTLMAVVVAFLRLSADSEIIALKSSGVSIYQMLPPVAIFSFIVFLIALSITTFAAPWGNRSFKDLLFKIAKSKADLGIKERVFSEPFEGVVIYVNSFSKQNGILRDVFVVDRRDNSVANTIIAEEGRILVNPDERIITLYFVKGIILQVEANFESARTINFNTYSLNIGLKDIMAGLETRQKAPHELEVQELVKELQIAPEGDSRRNRVMRELIEKISIPLSIIFMGMIGVPLGAQIRTRGRTAGIGISLVVFSAYYLFLTAIRSICASGAISPAYGVWLPDLFLVLSCIHLLRRASSERSTFYIPRFPLKKKTIS